jgi:hypothetical protein
LLAAYATPAPVSTAMASATTRSTFFTYTFRIYLSLGGSWAECRG